LNRSSQIIFSVSQITNQVRYELEKKFSNIWIRGEVSSIKRYPSGHIYITLKDAKSELSGVIFSQFVTSINCKCEIGMEIVAIGDLSLYVPRGQFQFKIKNLYLAGEGELWLAFETLKKKLEIEGVFDRSFKKKIPIYSNKIGIITSSQAAVLKDILNVLKRRAPHIQCCLYPVPVQGDKSAEKIANGIEIMNEYGKCDVLIVCRGGGSMEDLWAFNEEVVVRAIFASNIPVVSAIGHETDTTLSDYVADYIAPTPSAAAEIVSVNREELMQNLDYIENGFLQIVNKNIAIYFEKLSLMYKQYGFFKPKIIIENFHQNLKEKYNNLNQLLLNHVQTRQHEISLITNKLNMLNPKEQLQRGYALILDNNNKVISNSSQVDVDDIVDVQFSSSKLKTKVLDKENIDV
tara:strand:- start:571 stop:1785 length:1215 start_codon:yes stop_codon:yes gene_type:complete